MGLNITAYSRLIKIEEDSIEFGDFGLPINDRIRSFFLNPEYPYHMSGVEPDIFYICKGEKFDFRAGSYVVYNSWKNELAKLAGYDSQQRMWNVKPLAPFVELINFSDQDGTIGHVIAAKLAHDFKEYDQLAKEVPIPFFYEHYQNWKRSCEIAAKEGVIQFH